MKSNIIGSISSNPEYLLTNSDSCDKVTFSKQNKLHATHNSQSNGESQSLFSLISNSCSEESSKTWPIILGSILGAFILIVLVLSLVFTFNQKAKICIRPYYARFLIEQRRMKNLPNIRIKTDVKNGQEVIE